MTRLAPIVGPTTGPIEIPHRDGEPVLPKTGRALMAAWGGLVLILAAAAGLVWLVAHMVVMA